MESMHPHWETTDDSEQEVSIHIVDDTASQTPDIVETEHNVPAAKRSPAALFGIAMILVTGFFSFGGMDLFPAQVAIPSAEVVITEAGVDPREVTIRAGQRITWINNSAIPHILSSTTLKNVQGASFETTVIFPGSEASFDVPVTTEAGIYSYESKTSPEVNGTIIVEAAVTTMAPTSSAPAVSSFAQQSFASVASVVSSAMSSSLPVGSTTVDETGIPVNPYTVGNTYNGVVTKNPTATVTTHKPITNTESGAGLWIAATAGLIALLMVVRKAGLKA
jgi:plastocyanin